MSPTLIFLIIYYIIGVTISLWCMFKYDDNITPSHILFVILLAPWIMPIFGTMSLFDVIIEWLNKPIFKVKK